MSQQVPLLLNKAAFKADKLIPQATDDARVERFIREAQEFDLKGLLGIAFYNAIISNYVAEFSSFDEEGFVDNDDTDEPGVNYVKLIEGEIYKDEKDNDIIFPGLAMCLKYYAYARFINEQQSTVTTHSIVTKTGPYSTPVSDKIIAAQVAQARSGAVDYWKQAEKYLNVNKDKFPLWKSTNVQPRTQVKIRAVG